MRKIARVDANQTQIVETLRNCGCFVVPTHQLGGGKPDIWVSKGKNRSTWVEIKDGSKSPSQRKLTKDEAIWFQSCPDPGIVIETVEQAVQLAASL